MYRNIYESKFTARIATKEKTFITDSFTVPDKCDNEKALAAAKKAYRTDKGIILWNSVKLVEITETPYSMSDSDFLAFADKIDKPNPALITRTVNNTLVKCTVVTDSEEFTERTISLNGKFKSDDIESVIDGQIKDGYLFSVDGIKVVSGLYGITPEKYMAYATKGETKTIYKEG